MSMDRDMTLLLIGAAIALVSSLATGVILAIVQHILSLREDRIKRSLDSRDRLRKTLTGKVNVGAAGVPLRPLPGTPIVDPRLIYVEEAVAEEEEILSDEDLFEDEGPI